MIDHNNIVPQQEEGAQSNTESSIELQNKEEAISFYNIVKERLLSVNNWQSYAGAATASFQLIDKEGNEVQRTVQEGDHFKIDIPGPGTATGEGYDWVQVESIKEIKNDDDECVVVTVRPATNPTNDRNDVAHFFSEDATSSFIVKREGNIITAGVHGRNEKPNTNAETVADKARNLMVGLGAAAAFSKLQWKSLVNGLVKKED